MYDSDVLFVSHSILGHLSVGLLCISISKFLGACREMRCEDKLVEVVNQLYRLVSGLLWQSAT